MKLREDFSKREVVNLNTTEWVDSPSPGVKRKMLDRVGEVESARATTVVEFASGSKFPHHVHLGGEEFLILEGIFSDEHGDFIPGTYARHPHLTEHQPWSEKGCKLFDDQITLRTHTTKEEWIQKDGKKVLELFNSPDRNEIVSMENWEPNYQENDYQIFEGGEEILIIEGSLKENDEEWNAMSWIRIPDLESNKKVLRISGENGCKFWKKTGHLKEIIHIIK